MADIIPFVTRAEYRARFIESANTAVAEPSPLTPVELYKQYSEWSLQTCRDLVEYYKQTQRWNLTCEGHMLAAVRSLLAISKELAGANDVATDTR